MESPGQQEMSNSVSPIRSRRVLLLIAGVIGLCACAVIVVSVVSLFLFAGTETAGALPSPAATMPARTADVAATEPTFAPPTLPIVGAMPTSSPRASPPPETQPPPVPTVALAELATGELRLDYPLALNLEQEEIVTVHIVPDQPVALVGANPRAPAARLLVEAGSNDAPRRKVAYSIPLYSVMSAELNTAAAEGLVIVGGSESRQVINPFDQNFWTWSLVARRSGEYRITLRVFGYASLTDDDPLKQVVADTRIVRVNERPFFENLARGFSDNWLVLFGAGGPIALILAALSFWFARRESQKPKNPSA